MIYCAEDTPGEAVIAGHGPASRQGRASLGSGRQHTCLPAPAHLELQDVGVSAGTQDGDLLHKVFISHGFEHLGVDLQVGGEGRVKVK